MNYVFTPTTQALLNTGNLVQPATQTGKLLPAARDPVTGEFVEIANVSNAAVDLFDASHPTNTWHLKDAVSYVFPENMTVPPGGTVVIVNFDPTSNPQAVARFRTVYGVEPSVSLVGPYSGSLPNGRGKIELARPDKPQQAPDPDAGQVPYIVVDRVNYLDRAPWPPWADGTGRSLSRVG